MKLSELFDPRLVALDVSVASRDEVFTRLTDLFVEQRVVNDAQVFVTELARREESFSTSVGNELAIPHGKSEAVSRAAFAIATLSEPLQWDPTDLQDLVRLVVMLAVPEREAGSTHVRLLSSLASALMDDDFRAQLLAATHPDEVERAIRAREGE